MIKPRMDRAGLDIGSTTIKWWLEDQKGTGRLSLYKRHHADIEQGLAELLDTVAEKIGSRPFQLAITGSGGMALAERLDVAFVQEVIAGTRAVRDLEPDADAIVELGGEDAKITFLRPSLEQRMNGTCAGGTGAFIDQMASLLETDAAGLDRLASEAKSLYPIASRCGVFAKSDLQPLINDGARPADLAASIFQAVVNQTIAGLACGRPLQGTVVLLGGPLTFLPNLVVAFRRTLEKQVQRFIVPDNGHLVVAQGAARLADDKVWTVAELQERLRNSKGNREKLVTLEPLFRSSEERQAFSQRHQETGRTPLAAQPEPPYFLGFDAGSTTTKAVLVDRHGEIAFTDYRLNQGRPVETAVEILSGLFAAFPDSSEIQGSLATGYGENLVVAALGLGGGVVETMAHYRAARHFEPDVDFILDIGGQDMKCLHVEDGTIDRIVVNEACSSGCGSFLQTFADGLGLSLDAFAEAAATAERPVDLGTRCTVFMNSRVKQAQKEGAAVGEIAAGLAYSVVRNALYKVIKARDAADLGRHVVCQGGTFLNDAVLSAFERLLGRQVVRPEIAGLMGAFGAALLARDENRQDRLEVRLAPETLNDFTHTRTRATCQGCTNNCRLTINRFPGGRSFISGNRCERGASREGKKLARPNLFAYKARRLFDYVPRETDQAPRGTIGIPRVLNQFENYPFWFTLLDDLGFRVLVSPASDTTLFQKGLDSIPSESVCYPAKLAHGHIEYLIEQGVKTIFYPDVVLEDKEIAAADQSFNCPIVVSYPEVIRHNVASLAREGVTFLQPFVGLKDRTHLARQLLQVFAPYGVNAAEMKRAVAKAEREARRVRQDILQEGRRALAEMEQNGWRGIVLAGRPYHVDPGIHHGIPDVITGLGLAVLSEDSVLGLARLERPLRVVDQWAYHSRLYEAAAFVASRDDLELVQLNSFGCGLDAITADQVAEILAAHGKMATVIKIDEISNLGAARIRLRSLVVASEARRGKRRLKGKRVPRLEFTRAMKARHTLLAPQMSPIHFRLLEPVFRQAGFDFHILEKAGPDEVETGLRYVNNDACYPSILVVGQLIRALQSGRYDPDNTSLVLTQTGGGCRATNYVAFLRKALVDAGFPQVPVIALSASGIERHGGIRYTPKLLHRAIQAIVAGDVLQQVTLRVRPYEKEAGSTEALTRHWLSLLDDIFLERPRALSFGEAIERLIADFDSLPLVSEQRKPRVGLVGEILVRFHPDANNNAVRVMEEEGFEVTMPGLIDFFLYCFYNQRWKRRVLNTPLTSDLMARLVVRLLEQYRERASRALAAAQRFQPPIPIADIAELVKPTLSLGNHSGEGWLLTGEMLELIESGVPNILCAQPFACLPNHVTGKGMIRAIEKRYPEANIVAVDYDPGASEVNQLNRIRLMLSRARERFTED